MGAGKTTVIAPLLALLLGDGNTAVFQVVPMALLEMSRSVMRNVFSSLIVKPVYTFVFERDTEVDDNLYAKLLKARDTRAVVVSNPTAIKSFVLKFIEIMDTLDAHQMRTEQHKKGLFSRFNSKFNKLTGGGGGAAPAVDTENLHMQACDIPIGSFY
jgi:hypothetical protein